MPAGNREPRRGFPRRAAVRFTLLVLLLAAGLSLLRLTDLGELLQPEEVAARLEQIRGAWWSPLALVALYPLLSPLGFPVSPLIFAGGAVFGSAWGSLYNILGTLLGASASFLLARALGREMVAHVAGPRLGRFEKVVRERGFWPLVRVRFLPFPFVVVNFGAALTGVRFSTFFTASAAGLVPSMVVYTYFASTLTQLAAGEGDPRVFLHVALALALLLALTWLPAGWRAWRRR